MVQEPYSILITDDDEGVRSSLQAVIELRGYRTYLAGDGGEALEVFRSEHIHVCILDVNLPDMTGDEAWYQIRQEENRVLPCVFVTGDAASADRPRALSEPTADVVTKPLTGERVISSLETMIRRFVHGQALSS